MSWPVDQPKHIPWRERASRHAWTWPSQRVVEPPLPPPDYNTAPQNVTRMYVGACARDLQIDRMYYEFNNPPAIPTSPNLVWPRA